MSFTRRRFLAAGAFTAGAAALAGGTGRAIAAPLRAGRHPYPPRSPAAVRQHHARGWLAGQLRRQLDGLCGRYETALPLPRLRRHRLGAPGQHGLGGGAVLAARLRPAGDRHRGRPRPWPVPRRWIDAILATQESDGFFGPRALRTSLNGGPDFWPFLPLLMALRTYAGVHRGDRPTIASRFLTRFLQLHERPGARCLQHELGLVPLGRRPRHRACGCTTAPATPSCSTWRARCTPAASTGRPTPSRPRTTSTSPRASASPPSTRSSPAPPR